MNEDTTYGAMKAIFSLETDKPLRTSYHLALLDAGILQDNNNGLDLKIINAVLRAYDDTEEIRLKRYIKNIQH